MANFGDANLQAVEDDNLVVIALLTFLHEEGQKTKTRHQQFMAEFRQLLTQFKTGIVSEVRNHPHSHIQPNLALNYHQFPVDHHP